MFILFEASVGYSLTAHSTYLSEIYYTVDWSDENYYLYQFYNPDTHIYDLKQRTGLVKNVTLADVPEGSHTVTIFAVEEGGYLRDRLTYGFSMTAEYLFNFTIDTVPPNVEVLDMAEKVYVEASDVPLNFTVSEPTSKIMYSLNGSANVTVNGTATLSGLAVGTHNLTIYAWDEMGNVGKSDQVTFSIQEPEGVQEGFVLNDFSVTLLVCIATVLLVLVAVAVVWRLNRGKKEG